MKIGTKSVLFGVHSFWLHPFFVAWGWKQLYGWPWDPRLWLAFFVHDLGYIGKPNMDGIEGEFHVSFGALVMWLVGGRKWRNLCLYHSRFWAKQNSVPPSRLCFADKMSFVITPEWLYLWQANLTGEIKEYMAKADDGKYENMNLDTTSQRAWLRSGKAYMLRWIEEYKDGKEDTWTGRKKSAL